MSKVSWVLTLGAAVVLGAGSDVTAQNAVVAPPIINWSYQRHASTATEGFLRGQADVVQSVGQANYLNSLAVVNYQEAVRRSIENQGLFVRTYLENRELNQQFRERYTAAPPTKERWMRFTAAANPDRLTMEQYDSATGRLVWPHILRGDEYKAFRDRIDDLLANRTQEVSGDGSSVQREIASLVKGMSALLKTNIDTVSASQYGSAKWFLLCVAYEAQQPLDADQTPVPVAPVVVDQPTPVVVDQPAPTELVDTSADAAGVDIKLENDPPAKPAGDQPDR